MRMTLNVRVKHHAWGEGVVTNFEIGRSGDTIVLVKWDNPELSRWPGEDPVPEFWTEPEDLDIVGCNE